MAVEELEVSGLGQNKLEGESMFIERIISARHSLLT